MERTVLEASDATTASALNLPHPSPESDRVRTLDGDWRRKVPPATSPSSQKLWIEVGALLALNGRHWRIKDTFATESFHRTDRVGIVKWRRRLEAAAPAPEDLVDALRPQRMRQQ